MLCQFSRCLLKPWQAPACGQGTASLHSSSVCDSQALPALTTLLSSTFTPALWEKGLYTRSGKEADPDVRSRATDVRSLSHLKPGQTLAWAQPSSPRTLP